MSLRGDFSESVDVEVALAVAMGTSLQLNDGAYDRAEVHDMGGRVGYAFINNTEAAQKLIADKLWRMPESGPVAVSCLVEELAKTRTAPANPSAWEDLRLLLLPT